MLSKIYHTCHQFAEASQLCNPNEGAKQTGLNLLAARTFAKTQSVLLLYKILSITTLAQNCFIDVFFFYLFILDTLQSNSSDHFFLRSYKTLSNHPYHRHLLKGSTPWFDTISTSFDCRTFCTSFAWANLAIVTPMHASTKSSVIKSSENT